MADDDQGKEAPSLELPSFFGRKKRKQAEPAARQPAAEPPAAQPPAVAPPAAAPVAPPRTAPPVTPPPAAAPTSAPPPATPPPVSAPTYVPPPVQAPVQAPVSPPVVRPAAAAPAAPPTPPAPAPVTPGAATHDDSPTTILDDLGATGPSSGVGAGAPLFADEAPTRVVTATPEPAAPGATEPTGPREPREPLAPWLTGILAAVVTGLAVGVVLVLATAGSTQVCESVRGTSSCGGSGFFLLVAVLIVAALAGTALLRTAGVPSPGSTSVLAVGLVAVLTMLFLLGSIESLWMALVIPLLTTGAFALSYWVTTSFIDTDDA